MGAMWSSPAAPAQSAMATLDDEAVIACLQQADPARHDQLCDSARASLGLHSMHTPAQMTFPADEGDGEPETAPVSVKLSDYDFPFENLVFEGGGSKGRIYGGALKCLRDAGIKAKRFAGSSAGAITAALLAVNFTPEDIDDIMSSDLEKILLGGQVFEKSFWSSIWNLNLFKLLTSVLIKLGAYDTSGFFNFFGDILKKKTGDADITFEGILNKYSNELCITAVNVNLMTVVYFHPKTTPLMPVRLAVHMSMSIPGVFEPIKHSLSPGFTDYYVDGGVLCNYPIHVFDGWWLSMKPEDRYYKRLPSLGLLTKLLDRSERFSPVNEKSLGFLVYSSDEPEIMRVDLDKRIEKLNVKRPDTTLFKERREGLKKQSDRVVAHTARMGSSDRFVGALLKVTHKKGDDGYIARSDFKRIFADVKSKADDSSEAFNDTDARILFGDAYDADKLFDIVDPKRAGNVLVSDVFIALERALDLHTRILGHDRQTADGVIEYGRTLYSTLTHNAGNTYIQASDIERTVGLCTAYVRTYDFNVDPPDQDFLMEQGYAITDLFLRNYIAKHKLQPRRLAA